MDMKIVVLDGCAANSGDISWDSIGKYGELTEPTGQRWSQG